MYRHSFQVYTAVHWALNCLAFRMRGLLALSAPRLSQLICCSKMKRTRSQAATTSSLNNPTGAAQETGRRCRKPLPKASSRGAKPTPTTAAAADDGVARCDWAKMYKGAASAGYIAYHDTEWGVPEHDDNKLFELLILEGAQVGQGLGVTAPSRDLCAVFCVAKQAMHPGCCAAATASFDRLARGWVGAAPSRAQQAFCAAHEAHAVMRPMLACLCLSAGGPELVDHPGQAAGVPCRL